MGSEFHDVQSHPGENLCMVVPGSGNARRDHVGVAYGADFLYPVLFGQVVEMHEHLVKKVDQLCRR